MGDVAASGVTASALYFYWSVIMPLCFLSLLQELLIIIFRQMQKVAL